MSISDKINLRIQEVKDDQTGAVAARMRAEGAEAILKGVGSAEWETLMKNFTDEQSPAQLARLTLKDDQAGDPAIQENVIYLAASAACGAATLRTMTGYVNPAVLDMTVNNQPAEGDNPAANPQPGGGEGGGSNS